MFRSLGLQSVLTLATVIGLVGPAAAKDLVPFKGRFDGVVSRHSVDPVTDSVLVTATGNATHLGECSVSIPHLVNLPTRTAVCRYEFTAADGDTVIAEFTGQVQLTATPNVIYIVETATII